VAADPEALAQLARLLRDESLRNSGMDAVRRAVDAGFEHLVAGITEETLASDDVVDAESAGRFIADRVSFLGSLLSPEQCSQLLEALNEEVAAW
jgi:hypothetical protein